MILPFAKRRSAVKGILIALGCIVAAAALSFGALAAHIHYSTPTPSDTVREIHVEPGDSFSTVARKLSEQQIIVNRQLFSLWARFTGADKKLHLGFYRFETPTPAAQVLDRIVTGKGTLLSVTIPEGLTIVEIAELLAKAGFADKEKFIAATQEPELLAQLNLQGKSLEGYLFPSAYYFAPRTSERRIVAVLVGQFRRASRPLFEKVDESIKMTPHEIVTLASIIEKETGVEAERTLVAAVFHNRLKRGMPLQSDPTVIYGIKDFNGNLTRKDLQEYTPYNTYRIAALPPGPICNPGVASIKAALSPADDPALYFVSKNDGTHQFSADLASHNQAVRTYQILRNAAPAAKTSARAR